MSKKQDIDWHDKKMKVYVGHQVEPEMIYIGGPYYQDSAQLHLTLEQAKWLKKNISKALARKNKRKP